MAGLFITFEGGEGCGKSTQIRKLAEALTTAGQPVYQTREPGGTPLGEAIRNLLQHDEAGEGMCSESELLLFAASRAQLVRQQIRPALAQGHTVICDRFMDSTTVYQGVARALAPDDVRAINQFAVGETHPDLTILLDLAPEIGLARVKARSDGQLDRMEREAIEFFQAVREGFVKIAQAEPERFLILDANQDIDILHKQILETVQSRSLK